MRARHRLDREAQGNLTNVDKMPPTAMFVYSDRLVESLADTRISVGKLTTLAVLDEASAWSEPQIAKMYSACHSRGIQFRFYPDSSGMSSD